MKKTIIPMTCLAAGFFSMSVFFASAAVMIRYDSTTGNTTDLVIVGTTDNSLVSSADATTSIDANGTIKAGPHASQTNVQGPSGTGRDLHFRFGGNSTAISYALTPANALTGSWLGVSITAAQDISLDEFSFHLFANSQSGSLYAARDVGLFASLDSGTSFTQFGALDETATGNGNQGTITFTDTLAISSGQEVELRLLFSDKTSLATNLQSSTRIGDIAISGTAVPEPSAVALGLAGFGFLLRRRR
ncbi:PEP-CTERM sorting domain-containing protein, partial [bacterium]|nr:PEP-CTERM sorting domain-containing protein [bacterium]